jgi:hypothetical protein
VQLTPVEIRELNINEFRLNLKDLEDNEEGMAFIDTHNHNTEVLLGGIVYARVVEIINGYSVTFENGAYAVNLIGANSNIGDVINLNQVSVRSSNAAGLISNSAIEYASFDGMVTIGGNNAKAGTVFPIGTPQQPVSNLSDAKLIAERRGFDTLFLLDSLTIPNGQSIDNLNLLSENWADLIIEPGASCINTRFEKLSMYGEMSGYWNILVDCWSYNITNFTGWLRGGSFESIELAVGVFGAEFGSQSFFDDIIPLYPGITSVLTMNSGVAVSFTSAHDTYEIKSMVSGTTLNLGISEGTAILDSSCTGGIATFLGVGTLIDNSNGTVVNITGFVEAAILQNTSFEGGVTIDSINGVNGTSYPIGTPRVPVNNVQDAVLISEFRGFSTLFVKGDLLLGAGDDVSDYHLIGDAPNRTFIHIAEEALVSGIELSDVTVDGFFDGKATFTKCILLDIAFVEADISECTLKGTMTLAGSGNTIIEDSRDGLLLTSSSPVINFNGSGHNLAVRDYHGDLNIINKSAIGSVEINMSSGGRVTLEPTVTAGILRLTGILQLINNSTGAAVVDDSQVVYPEYLQLVAFKQEIHIDSVNGVSGTIFPIGTTKNPVSNISDAITIAEQRGITQFVVNGTLLVIGKNLDGYTLVGDAMTSVVVLVSNTGNSNNNTTFRSIGIAGQLNGYIYAERCAIQELSGIGSNTFPSVFSNCILRSDELRKAITLRNGLTTSQDVHFFDCVSAALDGETLTIDFNGSTTAVGVRRFGGEIIISNYNANQDSAFEFNQGNLTIDSSCTLGSINIGGIYNLVNNGTLGITERNGSVTANISAPSDAIATAVWGYLTSSENTDGSFGKLLLDLITKSNEAQHTLNVQTELLKNKPNNC